MYILAATKLLSLHLECIEKFYLPSARPWYTFQQRIVTVTVEKWRKKCTHHPQTHISSSNWWIGWMMIPSTTLLQSRLPFHSFIRSGCKYNCLYRAIHNDSPDINFCWVLQTQHENTSIESIRLPITVIRWYTQTLHLVYSYLESPKYCMN